MEEFAKWRAGAPERNNHLVGNRRQRRGSRIKEKGGRRRGTGDRLEETGDELEETGGRFVLLTTENTEKRKIGERSLETGKMIVDH